MSHRSLAACVAVIAIAWSAPGSVSGQTQAGDAADTASTWTLPRTPDGQPDLQGYWTTQTFTPLERPEHLADKEFFTEEEAAELQGAVDGRGSRPVGARRGKHRRSGGARAEAVPGQPRPVVHPLRQRDLAAHAGAEGSVEPAHLADHGSAEREDSAPDAGSEGTVGRRRRGAAAAGRLRQPRDPALPRALHRLGARGPAEPAARLQRHPPDLPDPGLRRRVHRAEHQPPAHHPARRPPAAPGPDPPVPGRLAGPLGGRHAGRRDHELQRETALPGIYRRPCTWWNASRASRPGPDPLRVHGRGPEHLDDARGARRSRW